MVMTRVVAAPSMAQPTRFGVISSPIGQLVVGVGSGGVNAIRLTTPVGPPVPDPRWERDDDDDLIVQVESQLAQYFSGERLRFDLPLDPVGTPFQRAVWAGLERIPYGETRSYGQVALDIGNARSCRAVGMANNRNPISIVVPCHRVIGADGALVGFGGGLDRKRFLLDLEHGVSSQR